MIILLVTLSVLLVISIGINISQYFIIKTLLSKIKIYEQWVISTRNAVLGSLNLMRDIDKQGVFSSSVSEKGLFESDDFVGQIFKQLVAILEELNNKIQE